MPNRLRPNRTTPSTPESPVRPRCAQVFTILLAATGGVAEDRIRLRMNQTYSRLSPGTEIRQGVVRPGQRSAYARQPASTSFIPRLIRPRTADTLQFWGWRRGKEPGSHGSESSRSDRGACSGPHGYQVWPQSVRSRHRKQVCQTHAGFPRYSGSRVSRKLPRKHTPAATNVRGRHLDFMPCSWTGWGVGCGTGPVS